MHPEYPNLEPQFSLEWKENFNVPVQPLSPNWKLPMFHCQLVGSDLERFNEDLKKLVLEQEERFLQYSEPSKRQEEKHPNVDLTSAYEDYNFFYVNHPAAETLFYYFRDAAKEFARALNIVHGMPMNILCWANALYPDQNDSMGEHAHQGEMEITYMSGNYCVTAGEDTATVFDMPGLGANIAHVQNKPGQLTLFPQWVDHWTTPFRREDDVRITIAADIDVGHIERYMWDDEGNRVHYLPLDSPPHVKARKEGIDVTELHAVHEDIVEFVNTPINDIKERDERFDLSATNESQGSMDSGM